MFARAAVIQTRHLFTVSFATTRSGRCCVQFETSFGRYRPKEREGEQEREGGMCKRVEAGNGNNMAAGGSP